VSFCLLDQGFGLKCSKAVNCLSHIALNKEIYAVPIVASGQFFLQAQTCQQPTNQSLWEPLRTSL
jgi:hypothetical protein